MDTPDWFLIAWWMLAAAVGIPTFILVRRSRVLDRQAAVLSHLKGERPTRRLMWPSPEISQPVQAAVLMAGVLLVIGGFAFIFMSDWTRLLFLNGQIFVALLGVCMVLAGLSARTFARAPSDWPRAITIFMRAGLCLFGILLAVTGSIVALRDVALPRRVVEGHVDSVNTYSRRRGTEYVVVIDGKRFRSTFEAFVHIQPNRPVHVEVGAGSGTILAADDNALRPVERRRRN